MPNTITSQLWYDLKDEVCSIEQDWLSGRYCDQDVVDRIGAAAERWVDTQNALQALQDLYNEPENFKTPEEGAL